MTKNSARRLSLSFLLGASMLGATAIATAQTSTPSGTNGITGTDPCPKNIACTAPPPDGSTGRVAPASGAAPGTVAQALLIILGLA